MTLPITVWGQIINSTSSRARRLVPHGEPEPEVVTVPPGYTLPDGRILTFPASSLCPCVDCVDAVRLWKKGRR
jgi:hypothetical protein